MKKTNEIQTLSGNDQAFSSKTVTGNLYLLNGNTLLPLSPEYLNANSPEEKNFRSAKELEELLIGNCKTLFGLQSIIVTLQKKDEALFGSSLVPRGLMLDLSNPAKPRVYILEIMLAKQDFYGYVFPRVTKFFTQFNSEETINKLCDLLSKDKEMKKILPTNLLGTDISAYLKNAIIGKPAILLVMDNEIQEMPEVMDIYSETWQNVKPVLFKKYASNGNTFCTMNPPFSSINRVAQKERKPREKVVVTEESHTEDVSVGVRDSYNKIKSELLKVDDQLQFNPQKYYISLRKNRNLAFFHLSIKKINLVVMNPEKETRKVIKHHVVKALKASVQQFWNGECCSIMIEDTTHLQEVISLLKKMVTA